MENTITLISGQKIEILMQDEVSLDIDCSLRYIESGKKEVEKYVEDVSKLQLDTVVDDAKNKMNEQIIQGIAEAEEKAAISAQKIIDENILSMKTEIDNYITGEIKPDIETAKTDVIQSAQTASQAAEEATKAYDNLRDSLELAQEVASGNIGDIKYTLRSDEPYGGVWCDGRILSETQYPDLYQLLQDNMLNHISLDEYESQIAESGCCYSFVIDEVNQIIKVPTIPVIEDSNYRAYVVCYTGKDIEIDITREIELNNPFSLLDYKWSEYELNNTSWLLSNGAFHSGATYVSVYELLLKIYNGSVTKEGVSVKLSTEAYEDTDFVLNTVDTTFRLPIKVKLASGNVVVGNGMTLGLTNGQFNLGLRNGSNIGFFGQGGAYGTNVGTSVSGNASSMEVSVGVTTDSLKSGIETSSNGLKLYFYVGETIQDANVINASGVLTRVAELSDSYISGLAMPSGKYIDLTLGASGSTYTAPANGWFVVQIKSTGTTKGCYVYMRNSTTGLVTRDYNYHPSTSTDMTVVTCCSAKKGEKVLINYDVAKTISFSSLGFIYAKGEN